MEVEADSRYSVRILKTVRWAGMMFRAGTTPILKGHVITSIREDSAASIEVIEKQAS